MLREAARDLSELARTVTVFARVEWARRRLGPQAAAAAMRAMGGSRVRRPPPERARLQRAIRRVDRLLSGGEPNCYRRALMEIALDSGAAGEPLMLGFRKGGGPGSGHAWLASHPEDEGRFDLVTST